MFRGFVNRLQARQQLDRVVVDECHMVLDANEGFRPELKVLGPTIAAWGAQIVCLTATLSPRDEEGFYRTMGFRSQRTALFRVATTRHNIQYRVRHPRDREQESVEDAVCAEVRAMQNREGKSVRIIVYGGTIGRTESIADSLGCPAYHSGIADAKGKGRIMQEWLREGGVITATNALGVGLDVPNVRMVIHAGCPRRLRDYAQESGRGGRDGHTSEAVIVCKPIRDEGQEQGYPRGFPHVIDPREADMIEYVRGDLCRRLVLDDVMDGRVDRVRCEEGEEVCDVCKGTGSDGVWDEVEGVDEGQEFGHGGQAGTDEEYARMERQTQELSDNAKGQRKEEMEQRLMFVRYLDDWTSSCVSCRFKYEDAFRHTREDCWDGDQALREQIEEESELIRKGMGRGGMEGFSGCYRCGLPQGICERWEVAETDEGRFQLRRGGGCQYGTLIFQVVAGFWVYCGGITEVIIREMMGLAEGSEVDREKAIRWMGTKERWVRMESSQSVVL